MHYVANQPRKAQDHFYGVREAKPDLLGVAIYDRLDQVLPDDPNLIQLMWRRRELESYLCYRDVLLDFAGDEGRRQGGDLFEIPWREPMTASIDEIEQALGTLGEPSPWGPDIKASDDFLDRVFKRFYDTLNLPNLMTKTDYHRLAACLPRDLIDGKFVEKLDAVVDVAQRARPREEKH